MELRQIQYFIQLFKDRNITKASKHLFISQQGLSKSINRLEDELGVPLFKRSASGVTPTRAANRLYDYFYKISDSCHELEKEIETIRQNRILNIFAYHGFALTQSKDIFPEYRRLHPDSGIYYEEASNRLLPEYLQCHKAGIAFMQAPIPGELHSHLIVASEPLYAIMDCSHPLAGQPCLTPSDLSHQEILFLDLMDDFNRSILKTTAKKGVSLEVCGTAGLNEYLHRLLGSSRIGFGSRLMYQYYNFPEISFIPFSAENVSDFTIETHLVTFGDLPPDEETRKYINYIKEKIQEPSREPAPDPEDEKQ